MALDIEKIRTDFPALKQKVHGKDLLYLDSAASTLKCSPVIDAITRHYSFEASNVHRGIHFLSSQATQKYEATRTTCQKFINSAKENEIIFTKGTTDSINLVANSYIGHFLKKDDEILISTMEHHSNIVPWQIAAQKQGAVVREIPINDDGEIILSEYKKLLASNKVKFVSITHVSNTLGTINPIKELIEFAHAHDAKFMVDAAQSASHIKIDVQELGCDFLAFSSHKMFGPTGVGVLYGKEELLNEMPPYQGGGAMIKEVAFSGTTYNDLPEKFEAGTPHIAGVIAFNESLRYISALGFDNIHAHEEKLLDAASNEIKKIVGVKIIGNAKNKSSVLSFVVDGAHPHDIGMILDQQGVAIRTGHHCTQPLMKRFKIPATARASFSIYNNLSDVERFISAVKKAKEFI